MRVGQQRLGLRMDGNRYEAGGWFKADPVETRDFSRWMSTTGLDRDSVME